MDLFLELSPNRVDTSANEPRDVANMLVLQVRNPTLGDVVLHNGTKAASYDFLPIDTAVALPNLSMVYLVLPLGEDDGCLATTAEFAKATVTVSESCRFTRVGDNTLVLFPKEDMEVPANGQVELVISGLVTHQPAGRIVVCRGKLFNVNGEDAEARLPVTVRRHPLLITVFEVAEGHGVAGFGDRVTFRWEALGADRCLFMPGDVSLDPSEGTGEHTTTLLKKTDFVLQAECGGQRLSRFCELVPLSAEIVEFKGGMKNSGIAQLHITVKNTRHAYLNGLGRIEVESGVKRIVEVPQTQKTVRYTLAVENSDGLIKEETTVTVL
ncbi:MAG: hypothetical protein LIQ30_11620 [Planctomycetes bacterium]|nr:hypothetical protein [Planctomycetota bacterium]MCD7895053.1 hypothetical protein [Planctomycetaceae bacterium]